MNEIKSTVVYPGGIEVFENVWEDPYDTIYTIEKECADTNSVIKWANADVRDIDGHQSYGEIRTNLQTIITDSAEKGNKIAQQLHNRFCNLLEAATDYYMYKHKILGVKHSHEYYIMLKYSDNQKFDAHVDGMPGSSRFLSCILYLNDNYTGGDLEFVNFDLTLKIPASSLIVFPSYFSYSHVAHPVTTGTKYALVAWLTLLD